MRALIKFSIFLALFSLCAWWTKTQTDGFTLAKVSSILPFNPAWETPSPSPEIRHLLSQEFSFLAKGAQSFVFASQDGQYVLKLFRHHHMRAPLWLKALPLPRLQARAAKLDAKLDKDFSSYKLAFDHLKEESGLVFLHLNKTDDLHTSITLVDKIGIKHSIETDRFEFLLQKRGTLLYPALEALLLRGEKERAKTALSELIALLAKRIQLGLHDKDPDLNTNFALLDGHPLQVDIGRFKKVTTPCDAKAEITRITENLHQFLEAHDREVDAHLQQTIQELPCA